MAVIPPFLGLLPPISGEPDPMVVCGSGTDLQGTTSIDSITVTLQPDEPRTTLDTQAFSFVAENSGNQSLDNA